MGLDGEDSLLPEEFEEYRLVRLLGAGAMGRVYLAEDRLLERPVAIKLIGARSPTEAARERFYNEARAVARLTHPNVVTIHRVGEARGRPFLVSELVRGESLDKLALPLPATRLRSIALGLARGLAAAHRRGVLHRDLKPANAMLSSDGEVKLLDFGLAQMMTDAAIPLSTRGDAGDGARPSATARSADPDATASLDEPAAHGSDPDTDTVRVDTLPGSGPAEPRRGIVGTPRYLAPEIWLGEPHSTRSDVYSLGALLYKLYTGRAPHHGASLYELARVATEVDVAPAVALGEEDARLARVIDRCLARDPDARLGSGEAVREALERLDDPAPVAGSAPPGNPYRGLLPFEAEHRGLFFGRSAEVRALLDRLRAEPMVVVAAESGAGKSSICRAGVLGAVAEGALGEAWTAVTVSPGSRPLRALAEALSPLVEGRAPDVEDRLRDEPGAIGRELRRRCAGKVLVVIDPLEALVTQASEDEARAAAEALGALAEHGGARVLAAARSDFLARLATLPMLGEALPRSLFLLRPIASELLREVVVGPARAAGFSFESDALVDALIEGAAGAGGGLPLLGFTLAALWDARDAERRRSPRPRSTRSAG
ncbi:MAG: serine/threonine-protein kinase [Byssovorax sp.]